MGLVEPVLGEVARLLDNKVVLVDVEIFQLVDELLDLVLVALVFDGLLQGPARLVHGALDRGAVGERELHPRHVVLLDVEELLLSHLVERLLGLVEDGLRDLVDLGLV